MFWENHTLLPLPFQTVWRSADLKRDEAPMGRAAEEVRGVTDGVLQRRACYQYSQF